MPSFGRVLGSKLASGKLLVGVVGGVLVGVLEEPLLEFVLEDLFDFPMNAGRPHASWGFKRRTSLLSAPITMLRMASTPAAIPMAIVTSARVKPDAVVECRCVFIGIV